VGMAPDALTAARGAYLNRRAAASLTSLALVMARLRGPGGCPWDAEQTHASLQVHLLEEAHEVIEAIDAGMTGSELEEELGDVLLQVAFHSQMAADDGRFDLASVAEGIVAKLIRRHPHVFGDVAVEDSAEVLRNWEKIKSDEKVREDPFEGIPNTLPALLATYKTQKRAGALGFSASESDARAELSRALDDGDLGAALFWLVALARALKIDPEGALRKRLAAFRAEIAGDVGH
jgi:MazG family protein